jgi:hypothetical protein
MKIIEFIANKNWLTKDSEIKPLSTSKLIPRWYSEADRFFKMGNGEYHETPGFGKTPTWKACPSVLDILTTGYSLVTPCDVEFFITEDGTIDARVEDKAYLNFVTTRPPMQDFHNPEGYQKTHFAWWPEWGVKVPDGYSVLYVSPFNRYDLPFMTVSGIVDNDKVNLPGLMPFFIQKDWTGIIPAGTPYAQLLPFLREDWKSEISIPTEIEITHNNIENSKKYRIPDGGVYRKKVWTRRSYE